MSTNNPVFNVLAASGNQAPLAAGSRYDALAVGQVGVFNFHTGLSVDGTVPSQAEDIVIAVGLDRDGDGNLDDISTSAGQMIQVRNTKSLMLRGYSDEVSKVVDVTGFVAKPDTDYVITLEVRDARIYGVFGYNGFHKPFSYHSNVAADGITGDAVEVAKGLMDAINADPEKFVVASLFVNRAGATIGAGAGATANITVVIGSESYSVAVASGDTAAVVAGKIAAAINAITTASYYLTVSGAVISVYSKLANTTTPAITIGNANGTGVTATTPTNTDVAITDTAAFKAANPLVSPTLRITGQKEVRSGGTGINVKYHKTGIDFLVIPKAGFETYGKATLKQALVYLQGAGYDLLQEEYIAQGWGKAGPYRTNAVTGLGNSVAQFISPSGKYSKLSLTYDIFSVGGWLEYRNNVETILAIPCADTTTLSGLVTILDRIFVHLGAMTDDLTNVTCTSPSVNAINNALLDGVESLA